MRAPRMNDNAPSPLRLSSWKLPHALRPAASTYSHMMGAQSQTMRSAPRPIESVLSPEALGSNTLKARSAQARHGGSGGPRPTSDSQPSSQGSPSSDMSTGSAGQTPSLAPMGL